MAVVSSEGSRSRGNSSTIIYEIINRIHLLPDYWTQFLTGYWPQASLASLPRRCFHWAVHNVLVDFIRMNKREQARQKPEFFVMQSWKWYPITVFVRSKSLGPSNSQREEIAQQNKTKISFEKHFKKSLNIKAEK